MLLFPRDFMYYHTEERENHRITSSHTSLSFRTRCLTNSSIDLLVCIGNDLYTPCKNNDQQKQRHNSVNGRGEEKEIENLDDPIELFKINLIQSV